MNILVFNWRDLKHSWAGGGEIYVFELAKRWVKSGNKVTVFCSQDLDRKLPAEEKYDGITIKRMGNRFSVYIWAIIFYLFWNKEKFDFIVDVENGIPFFTPLFCFKKKIAVVHHVHDKQFFYELPFPLSYIGFYMEKYLFPLLYKNIPIIAVSQTTKGQLANLGFKRNRIFVVYNGVEVKHQRKLVRKFSKPTLIYLGRIKSYKRVDLLVPIFEKVLQKFPKARLIIAGWGTDAPLLSDMIMKSKVRRSISLMGPVSEREKQQLLSKSWLFVNPSIGEGWSIAVMEANLHQTPAIAFHVPGLSESIQHKETGLLAKNTEDMIANIVDLLRNKKIRELLAKQATIWAQQFTWDNSAKKTLKLFRQL